MAAHLPLTGERTVPGIEHENYWLRRHEVAYRFAAPLVAGSAVLEIGSGEGYGTALLARTARRVLGLDYDRLAVSHAARRYRQARFVRGNLAALPVRSGVFDVIVTLQVIEHVWDHGQFLHECRRALRPGGLLLVTTPNRLTFSPGHDEPVNPFHTKEFTSAELTELMSAHGFDIGARYGVHAGARLVALDAAHDGSLVDAQLRAAPEDWPDRLRRDVASVVADDFVVAAAELRDVDQALDLAVVAYRPA